MNYNEYTQVYSAILSFGKHSSFQFPEYLFAFCSFS